MSCATSQLSLFLLALNCLRCPQEYHLLRLQWLGMRYLAACHTCFSILCTISFWFPGNSQFDRYDRSNLWHDSANVVLGEWIPQITRITTISFEWFRRGWRQILGRWEVDQLCCDGASHGVEQGRKNSPKSSYESKFYIVVILQIFHYEAFHSTKPARNEHWSTGCWIKVIFQSERTLYQPEQTERHIKLACAIVNTSSLWKPVSGVETCISNFWQDRTAWSVHVSEEIASFGYLFRISGK